MTVVLSLMVAVALLLGWGGWRRWQSGDRNRSVLMAIAALVLIGNVVIWTLPTPDGATLIDPGNR